ncbi:hypothetical protein [Chitinophaga silvisoli]|uniref:hypothetical protein n=1 Tax=Chitinophaga silvisoli TaxID=2291814 RepID=UPI001314BF3F|nr:hypothetical protein [Chitinophaga silvisoli]
MKQAKQTTGKQSNLSLNKEIISKLNACGCGKGSNGQNNNYSSINTLPTGVSSLATITA